jgi:uncharacterized protein (TIGR01777 family)
MKILVTGGTGFVGSHLCAGLTGRGHFVTALGTRAHAPMQSSPQFQYLQADTTRPGQWQDAVEQADVIVNLAGRSIFHRWSQQYKQKMFDSRILTTRNLVQALPQGSAATLISASAVGFYGDSGERELTEVSVNGQDFLAELSREWEKEAAAAERKGSRVVIMRLGIVLGADGGALATMLPAFRSFVGGPLGSGRQWFPWIHIHDLKAAFDFVISRTDLEGPFNLCSPNPVRNAELAQALGQALGRPAKFNLPKFIIKTVAGELGQVLLASQKAVPARLLEAGFEFDYPKIQKALQDLVAGKQDKPQKPEQG